MGFESVAEEKIREAMRAGAFDNLPGMGKPLNAVDDDFAGDNWMAFNLLRSNGFLPEWLELRKQIYVERDAVNAAMREWGATIVRFGSESHVLALHRGELFRAAATAINAKIDLHNLRCPSIALEIARFREDAKPTHHLTSVGSSES